MLNRTAYKMLQCQIISEYEDSIETTSKSWGMLEEIDKLPDDPEVQELIWGHTKRLAAMGTAYGYLASMSLIVRMNDIFSQMVTRSFGPAKH